MASVTPPEKVGLIVDTQATRLVQKPSQDTFGSETMTPSAEKTQVLPRTSNISTPTSAHHANPFDTDIEAIITTDTCNRKSTECTKGGPDCQVWPGRDHWRRKAKANKMSRHNCNCLAHMSKRNRIIVKILIGMLIIGIAVGVGLGISKPLGAGIWKSSQQNS
ncbi:hypothetical protein QBC34DRAFT_47030 [Podospora aff. communis PSN243]|uniref:Uncharacterized protein n=1 Tax=Podospora aff. communis PSN243 TaxID=3040156 RepID=A0AAV9GW34_9PEZI|nr:hypothetical protein QBC34DRAFT_47030 [Podospora aff. communis PSN243]